MRPHLFYLNLARPILCVLVLIPAHAQTKLKTLYSFKGTQADGATPVSPLLRDSAGNLYGATYRGGISGVGTVFKIDSSGKETVLHSFTGGADGAHPRGGLVLDAAGNLYGTASQGGSATATGGSGTVFSLDTTGKETVLYSFAGIDGAIPYCGLVRDAAGNLYGTTVYGGTGSCPGGACGTVFEVDSTGKENVLYSFTGSSDGEYPYAGLLRDAVGNLYGTTLVGGASGYGTVFKLDTAGNKTVLYSFTGGVDGAQPYAGLVMDGANNLYGTTYYGGRSTFGTVFKLDTKGQETVLYSFSGGNGAHPTGGLVRDAAGNLYGTTYYGGSPTLGYGTVFKLDTTGRETILYTFTGGSDGANPAAGLVRDAAGNLYGTPPRRYLRFRNGLRTDSVAGLDGRCLQS